MPVFFRYSDLLKHLQELGHRPHVLGHAPDGSPLVAVRCGGEKLPAVFIASGSHSTEQAGVSAAIELIESLDTDHQVFVIPCRDPMGLNGFSYVLSLALGEEPSLETEDDLEALLREEGEVLFEQDDTLVALIGEYGYSTRGLYGRFEIGEEFLEPVKCRRVFFPSLDNDVEGSEPFRRAYTLIVSPEGEVLHINRYHDTPWAPVESRCTRQLMEEIQPGLTLDLHEYYGDRFWLSARRQRTEEGDVIEQQIAREAVRAVTDAGADMPDDDYLPGSFFEKLENGAYLLIAGQRGEGLNLSDFAAHTYGLAYTIETGMQCSFDDRVRIQKVAAMTAIRKFEEQCRK